MITRAKKTHQPSAIVSDYMEMVASQSFHADNAQIALLNSLQIFCDELNARRTRFLRRRGANSKSGFYVYGGVGQGKSALMDIFYQNVALDNKTKIHFNTFMRNFHARLHELKNTQKDTEDDLVEVLTAEIAKKHSLICLDEMQIGDVADALILRRILTGLVKNGVRMTFTSNRAPEALYQDVFQRDKFEELVRLIYDNFEVVKLQARQDYRLGRISTMDKVYFYPLGAEAANFAANVFAELTNNHTADSECINVLGHDLIVPQCCDDVAKFSFHELCVKAYSASDYAALAARFKVVIVTDVPRLTASESNEARRFISFIDELYERKVKLVCTADTMPEEIYVDGIASFEFKRTISRLAEMQSRDYLESFENENNSG